MSLIAIHDFVIFFVTRVTHQFYKTYEIEIIDKMIIRTVFTIAW